MVMTAEKSDLLNMVESIAKRLESGKLYEPEDVPEGEDEPSVFDWLSNALHIEYTVDNRKELLGARIMVAWGGPTIWVDTRRNRVEGYWWNEKEYADYIDNVGLNDAVSELWECLS
jgi:hypothetical protein